MYGVTEEEAQVSTLELCKEEACFGEAHQGWVLASRVRRDGGGRAGELSFLLGEQYKAWGPCTCVAHASSRELRLEQA